MGGQQVCACVLLLAVLPIGQAVNPASAPSRQLLTKAREALMTGGATAESIITTMMDYQKLLSKEARANQKAARADKELEIKLKSDKLQNESKQIEQQMEDAAQKAQALMDAVDAELRVGAGGGSGAAGTGSSELLVNHLRSVQTLVRGLPPRPSTPGAQTAAGPDLRRALERFAQLKTRLAAATKRVDDEIKKK